MSIPELVADSKKSSSPLRSEGEGTIVSPSSRKAFDPNITTEEYIHYAKLTRQQEETDYRSGDRPKTGLLHQILGRSAEPPAPPRSSIDAGGSEKNGQDTDSNEKHDGHEGRRGSRISEFAVITNDEWRNASRALRTASWGAGFYLITTDILGTLIVFSPTSLLPTNQNRSLWCWICDGYPGLGTWYRAVHSLRIFRRILWLPPLAGLHGTRLLRISGTKLW